MTRRLKTALELVSDIGCKGFDLQQHSERDIVAAVVLLRTVNAPMFDWLTEMLIAGRIEQQRRGLPAGGPVPRR